VRRKAREQPVELGLALLPAAEAHQAEDARRRREHHGVARPLREMPLDRIERARRVALDRERDGVDVALLARGQARCEVPCLRRRLARLRHLHLDEMPSRHCDVRQRELRVGLERAREVRLHAFDAGEDAVAARDVGIARGLRGRGNGQRVTIGQHGLFFSLELRW
jgi:hypothetical protein